MQCMYKKAIKHINKIVNQYLFSILEGKLLFCPIAYCIPGRAAALDFYQYLEAVVFVVAGLPSQIQR